MSAGWITTGLVAFAVAMTPVVVLALRRTAMGPLNAAGWIVAWGLLIAVVEHSYFGISEGATELTGHARIHVLMGLLYWPLAAIALAVALGALLREGRRVAWLLLLGLLLAGGGAELVLNGPAGFVFQHGLAADSRPEGMALYAYPVAWAVALAITYRPIFRAARRPS